MLREQQTTYYPFEGGLDLSSPAIVVPSGRARSSLNYEAQATGYRRIDGYERYDGHPSPSDATFWLLDFHAGVGAIAAGQTVTGQTSGATGVALDNATVLSGSYGASNAVGYLPIGAQTGTFVVGENIRVGGVTKAVGDGPAQQAVAPDQGTAITWRRTAVANARALIAKVPGSGPVRGVWWYKGLLYAFRDNAGATAGVMWMETPGGWSMVPLSKTLAFTSGGGAVEPEEGDVIKGHTSLKTATIKRVVVTSGDWDTGDAAGYFVIDSQSGPFVAETLDIDPPTGPDLLDVATIAGDSVAVTLPPGGRYEFTTHNFYGQAGMERVYGCNGVGKGFEFDGTTFAPITTQMPIDMPRHVATYKKHLFFSFAGGELQHSSIGEPLTWDPVTGALSLNVGHEITGLIENVASLTILSAGSLSNLLGNDATDWVLDTITDEAGAIEYTADKMTDVIYMDNRGVRTMTASQIYGNFSIGTITERIVPLLRGKQHNEVIPCAVTRVRDSSIYRLFYADGTCISIFFGKKIPECMVLDYRKKVSAICSAETQMNVERIWFGSDDGFVYEMDKGTSFDGEAFDYYLRLPFNQVVNPQVLKRWHKAVLEVNADLVADLKLSADFDYADPDEPSMPPVDTRVYGGGGIWEISIWDTFLWSSPLEGQAEAYLDGVGKNMSIIIAGSSAFEASHLLQGITLFYSVRGLQR